MKIITVCRLIILLFTLTTLLSAQNINNKNSLDVYKDFCIWQEKENFSSSVDSVLTVLGRWAWGNCLAVDADSNFAYIGNGPTFHVLDISEPWSPEIVGEYLTDGYVYDIELRDKIAFVCIGRGLLILDISNPSLPEKISEISVSGVAISFALVDSFAYVTTFSGVMQVVDISDINNPFKRGVIAAGGQLAFCVEAKDRFVYIGNPEIPPMVIVDATNPDMLTRVDFEVGGWGYSAFIKDTLLFIGVHGYSGRQFKIYNVSNASSPEFVGQQQLLNMEDIMAITVSEDKQTAFIRTTSGSVYSLDISDLAQPEIIDEYEKPIASALGNTGIAFSNKAIYSAHYNGLLTLDVLLPDSLSLQSFFATGGTALEMDSKDSLVFVASGLSGLWVLDVSIPEKPKPISNVNTDGFTADIIVEDTLAYIVNWAAYSEEDTSSGLWIIDISNIAQPKIIIHYKGITNFSTTSEPNSITKSGDLIFITQQPRSGVDSILEIIDVSDMYKPKRLGIFVSDYCPKSAAIKDTILFLSTSGDGLRIINIKNLLRPVEINVFSDSSYLTISDVYDNLLYTDRTDSFFVLDISDPLELTILGRSGKTEQGTALNLIATKNYAYTAGLYLTVFDVSDKMKPKKIAQFESHDYGSDVAAINDKIVFADGVEGLWILKNNFISSTGEPSEELPNTFKLYQNYPNPFNPSATIEFEIPEKEIVVLEIFDLLGQRVKTLLNTEMEKGVHKIVFNSTNLSSGIYFYRLIAGRHLTTKKMILIR